METIERHQERIIDELVRVGFALTREKSMLYKVCQEAGLNPESHEDLDKVPEAAAKQLDAAIAELRRVQEETGMFIAVEQLAPGVLVITATPSKKPEEDKDDAHR